MDILSLRAKHPIFHYQSFKIEQGHRELIVKFNFLLEPDIKFVPEIRIPLKKPVNEAEIMPYVFSLGLVEAISYWKAACPPVFAVEAGSLDNDQLNWWHDLFINGLGEFFYRNELFFAQPDFLSFKSSDSRQINQTKTDSETSSGDLILVGGGKDSIVTLEATKNLAVSRQVMLLNPNPAMLNVTKLAGFNQPLIVIRAIDHRLFELNDQGYLNGHTPFSAYLAFLSLLVGKIYKFKHLITSNEESASVGTTTYQNLEINHQYSKSYRFEKMFREYTNKYLGSASEYFSLQRPLSELQIAMIFTRFQEYFPVFNSCNVGRGKSWCGNCPKCAFVFLILSPFIPTNNLIKILGKDLLNEESLAETFLALVGVDGFKPFDCVGTKEEASQAVSLTVAKYRKEGNVLPKNLELLAGKLNIKEPVDEGVIIKSLKANWNSLNFLPDAYEKALKNMFI